MYNAIIVDDEILVIKSLKGSINWEEQGFYVIGHALNGLDCLELIKNTVPDIIFTDIRMPGMNGLELIKKIHSIYPQIQFVVVSGYAEFAYAQKAIDNGAIGYCLKPFDDDEIINVLKKAKNILNKNNSFDGIDIFSILEESVCENFCLIDLLRKYGLNLNKDSQILIAVTIGTDNIDIDQKCKCIKAKIGSKKNLYILQHDENQNMDSLIDQLSNNALGVGVSIADYSSNSLKKKIDEASIAAYQYFISGKGGVYYSKKLPFNDTDQLIRELEEARTKKDILQLKYKLDIFLNLCIEGHYTIKHSMRIYNLVMSLLYCLTIDKYDHYIYSYEQLTELFENNKELIAYLKSILGRQLTSHPEIIPDDVKNQTFRNILKYVNDNFCNQISIQSIGKEFCANPSYICQMFKKELGLTFSEYITSMRIAKAQDLLKLTELSVGDVAEKTGYNDYFHFTKTFKKIKGMTPSQYRVDKKQIHMV